MQVVHVIRDLELTSGGPSRAVPQLVMTINRLSQNQDWSQHIVFGDRGNDNATIATDSRLESHGIRSVVQLTAFDGLAKSVSQIHSCHPITLMHVHGLWSPELHQVIRLARTKNIPYVVSPQGMLSPWCFNYKWLKKRMGWLLYQYSDLNKAVAIHVTSEAEQSDVRRLGVSVPIFVIPNGMQVSEPRKVPTVATQTHVAVCISRLHPVKGLEFLVEAWANLQPPNWKLVIAGPSEAGTRERLAIQIRGCQSPKTIELRDAVVDQAKTDLLNEAELFVLPSFSENFGVAIAESLAHGIPVITTTGTPWSAIVPNRCGWFVAPEVHELQQALHEATACTSATLADMGRRGQALIASEYSWETVASRMMGAYASITTGAFQLKSGLTSIRT